MIRRALLFSILALALGAVVVDRIVATVGRAIITDGMVRRSLRAAALLNRTPLDESQAIWDETRNRLIEQALVKDEIRISRYPMAQPDEVRAALEGVRRQVPNLDAALAEYRLTESDLESDLAWRITFERFLAYRFRPAVQITDDTLKEFYGRWKPEGPKPAFDAARERLEAEFVAAESARLLDQWLRETRQVTHIETFQAKGARR
ncbi:MAG: hypothetical protein FJW30_01430 [Acidobacteria bacterium]|nr:hypothetical protein [Acidobacteriota bacterium]